MLLTTSCCVALRVFFSELVHNIIGFFDGGPFLTAEQETEPLFVHVLFLTTCLFKIVIVKYK